MTLFRVALPIVLLAGLLFLVTESAEASPVPRIVKGPIAHGGVGVSVGVALPVRPAPRRAVGVRQRAGRWVVQESRVWVPGELIGYDRHGHEIYTQGQWVVERNHVWVPAPRGRYYPHRRGAYRRGAYRPGPYRARPRGYVAVGATFR